MEELKEPNEPKETDEHQELKYLDIDESIRYRISNQLSYFEKKSAESKQNHIKLKKISISCSVLTNLSIALAFAFKNQFTFYGIIALISSTIVLAVYQFEEFLNYGSMWMNYRIIANKLRSEMNLFITKAGRYKYSDLETNKKVFIETIEMIIEGGDISFAALNTDKSYSQSSIEKTTNTLNV